MSQSPVPSNPPSLQEITNAPAIPKTTSPSRNSVALARHQTIGDARSLASTPGPPRAYHPFSPAVIALLMPASIFGVLARLGLQALANYNGRCIFPLAYPQALGCLVMGIALPLKDTINDYYGPLYTAITTGALASIVAIVPLMYLGFCGSLTTFSSWQLDIFYSWINQGQFHRSWLRDAVDGISKLFFTLLISLGSLTFGVHIGVTLLPFIPKMRPPSTVLQRTISVVSVLVYFASFPTYFRLSASFRHQATAALLFSFPGTLTRYALSVTLNPRSKLLPIGTLVANELGTSLLALFHTLQGLKHPVSPGACSILQGLEDGYCGCLTTVSTFAAEVRALAGWRRWLYGTISIVMAQVLVVLILGSTLWTGVASAQISCELI